MNACKIIFKSDDSLNPEDFKSFGFTVVNQNGEIESFIEEHGIKTFGIDNVLCNSLFFVYINGLEIHCITNSGKYIGGDGNRCVFQAPKNNNEIMEIIFYDNIGTL